MPPTSAPSPPPGKGTVRGRKPPLTIGVFAKHWTPGAAKTRLAASIGDATAAAVSRLFVETTLRRLTPVGDTLRARLAVVATPAERVEAFQRLVEPLGEHWLVQTQATGALGARMRAFFAQQSGPALLVGSDTPHLPIDAVQQAARFLTEASPRRAALAPTEDGGYWLVGCAGEAPPLFDGMPWSQPALFDASERRLEAVGYREGVDYRRLARWYDIDESDDLSRLRRDIGPTRDAALADLSAGLDALLGPTQG